MSLLYLVHALGWSNLRPRFTLCVLDFGQCPDKDKLESMVKTAATICHQGPEVACLVTYPVAISQQSEAAHLKNCRKVEDSCLNSKLNLRTDVSVHYKMTDDRHDGDARKLFEKMRLVYSSKIGDHVSWLQSDIIQKQGGCLDGVPLCRVRDLRTKYSSKIGPMETKLSPLERASQRGPEAVADILQKLLTGMDLDATSKVVIIDFFTREGDWIDAVALLQDMHRENPSSVPFVAGIGFHKKGTEHERSEEADSMKAQLEAKLMDTLWEKHPDAGLFTVSVCVCGCVSY